MNRQALSNARRSSLARRQLCSRRSAGRRVVAAAGLVLAICLVNQAHSVARVADESVGFEEIRIGYGDEPELKGGVWFPTVAKATPHAIGSATLNVALGAQPKGRALPLIVLSHGGGGSFEGHHDTAMALAQAGFVAAAITHAGDSYEDQSRVVELWRRPDQLARLISHMLGRWHARDRIDASRVGAFGFSNGGFTTLVVAGGIPNLNTIERYCTNILRTICARRWIAPRSTCGSPGRLSPAAGFTMAVFGPPRLPRLRLVSRSIRPDCRPSGSPYSSGVQPTIATSLRHTTRTSSAPTCHASRSSTGSTTLATMTFFPLAGHP